VIVSYYYTALINPLSGNVNFVKFIVFFSNEMMLVGGEDDDGARTASLPMFRREDTT